MGAEILGPVGVTHVLFPTFSAIAHSLRQESHYLPRGPFFLESSRSSETRPPRWFYSSEHSLSYSVPFTSLPIASEQ